MRPLLAALAVALAVVSPAVAAAPDDLSTNSLDRAALLALPSVYRVEVTMHVQGLRTKDGTVLTIPPAARVFQEVGTAFAVAPGGWLVSAAHVAAPDATRIAALSYQSRQRARGRQISEKAATDWVRKTGARAVNGRVVGREITQADAGAGALTSRSYMAMDVVASHQADLVAMRIDLPAAPALALDESASIGTPVATIGFGVGSVLDGPARGKLVPAVRRGRLGRTGALDAQDGLPDRSATLISVPVEPGDSGAPVIDAEGHVRGVVIIRTDDGGVAEQATEVRQLMEGIGVTPAPGPTATLFRGAMADFWNLNFAGAQKGFTATLAAFGGHTLAGVERRRAEELAAGDYRLEGTERRRGVLLAVGVLAIVAALVCGLALARPGRGRPGDRRVR